MSAYARRAALLTFGSSVLGVLFCVSVLPAQPPPPIAPALPRPPGQPASDSEFSHAISLPTDNKLQNIINAANDFIKEQLWGDAGTQLQRVLDIKEDVFIRVKRTDKAGKESPQWISVRAEANRLIGTMPPKGLEFYELQSGGNAKKLLREATEKSDPQLLAEVAQRYLYTEAGKEATDLLGSYHLDRGRFVMAALCYERLLQRAGADKLAPVTLFKACLAFRRTGDKANAEEAWKQLTAKSPRDGLQLGNRKVALDDARKLLERYDVPASELLSPTEWTMPGGAPHRSAQGVGGTPFMEKNWAQPLITTSETKEWVKKAIAHQEMRSQPLISASEPIALSARALRDNREENIPLIIYRSFKGVTAVNLNTGKLEWESDCEGSLDRLVEEVPKATVMKGWVDPYYTSSNPNLFWENSTLGTLSTDGAYVYAIDDLALPPHPTFIMTNGMNGGFQGGQMNFGRLQDAVYHSVLRAFELETNGKLVWQLGGRGEGPFDDAYFLGAPLPLAGKLYFLMEKNQEIKLVCLDPQRMEHPTKNPHGNLKDAVVWMQSLGSTKDKMLQDVGRRVRAATLAYGEGMLICPTNAGAIFGVDLLTHSLVWAQAYRDKAPQVQEDAQQQMMRMQGRMRGGMMVPATDAAPLNSDWKTTAPIIQDGKVVFAAPDGSALHCLNLRDGAPIWKAERRDGIYLGGVFNGKVLIVGKSTVRALNLSDGQKAWEVETGQPSGIGVASDNIYYLPLRAGAQSKEPEVCPIDIVKGVVLPHDKIRRRDKDKEDDPLAGIPGNLVFFEGSVISQTPTTIAAYPLLKSKLAMIDEAIRKNPKDPAGLTERGELKLGLGDLPGALEDLFQAMKENPPKELAGRTKEKLYDTLTEVLNHDFKTGEKYLDTYQKLCKLDIDPKLPDEERKTLEDEQLRRQSNYLSLVAKGREEQGRLLDAFQAYVEFGALAGNKDLVSIPDDRNVRASPEVWARGRIEAMVAKAAPEQRKPLEDKIAQQLVEVKKTGDVEALRRFVGMFGLLFSVGKEARLELANRLIGETAPEALLEAEKHLKLLCLPGEEPALAARAYDVQARLYLRKGLFEDAAACYRKLGHDYGQIVIRDGKTGANLLDEMAADQRLLPYVDEPGIIASNGPIQVKEEHGNFPQARTAFTLEPEGDTLPFFKRHRVALDMNNEQLKIIDRVTGEEVWSQKLPQLANMRNYFNYAASPNGTLHFRYHANGHLIVLQIGYMVYALDTVGKKVLWDRNMYGTAAMPTGSVQMTADGGVEVYFNDGWIMRLGQTGPTDPSYVCLQTRDGLEALEPLSGRTLWKRANLTGRVQMFGDNEHVYVVEYDAANNVTGAKALRAHDGVAVTVPDFATLYRNKLRVIGRNLLVSEVDAKGNVVLRLYDVQTGADLWKQTFPPKSIVLRSEDPDLAGVADPDGKVTVVDLNTRREALKAVMSPKHLEKVLLLHLLRDESSYYVAVDAQSEGQIYPNVLGGYGMRSLRVNGYLYCFERTTGKLRWRNEMLNEHLVLERWQELPMLLFTARYQKANVAAGAPPGPGMPQRFIPGVNLQSVDKRTGKMLWDKRDQPYNVQQFYALNVDQKQGRIEFIGSNMKLVHILPNSPAAIAEVGGAGDRAATPQSAAPEAVQPPAARLPARIQVGAQPARPGQPPPGELPTPPAKDKPKGQGS
jgi:outer membrane protein assembly factor BamB